MDWKLELVVIPVTDVDRAKHFYGEQVGFVVDHDTRISDDVRVVQLTPAGSACSIAIGTGMPASTPGSVQGIQLVVSDIDAARAELLEGGVEVSAVQHFEEVSGWMDEAETGTRSSFSAIPTATAGRCRSAPPTIDAHERHHEELEGTDDRASANRGHQSRPLRIL